MNYDPLDQVATGEGSQKLRLMGRVREGKTVEYLLLEEPGEPVLMHYLDSKGLVPHYKRACPNCRPEGAPPKAFVYVGAFECSTKQVGILEMSWPCFLTCQHSAVSKDVHEAISGVVSAPKFRGLWVSIIRANVPRSPRVLRCKTRVGEDRLRIDWPYRTREELARIFGIAVKPRLYRAEGGAS